MISPITFGPTMSGPRCGDCSEFRDGYYCTMNCGPSVPLRETKMAEPKERVRVQAGREGGPKQVLPAVPSNIPMPAVQPTRGVRPPRSMLEVIAEAVANPAVDVEKMKALLDMQERIEDREAQKAFTRAFNALQEELPIINKDGIIDHGEGTTAKGNKKLKTKWATYPNIMSVCRPLLRKHGFTLSNVIEPSADVSRIVVVGYLEHIEGHSRISRFPLGIDTTGSKNNQQGWGSSQQYGMRYNAIALLNIVSEAQQDLDNDGYKKKDDVIDVVRMISAAEVEELKLEIDGTDLTEARVCGGYDVESFKDIPAGKFAEVRRALKAYKAKHG